MIKFKKIYNKRILVESSQEEEDEFLQTHRLFDESPDEFRTRMKIVSALKNDGAGNSYPEAAKRVEEKFKLQIIPTADEPDFVAATDPSNNIILLAEDIANALFSTDKAVAIYTRGAVCMLIRHELLHHLLKHMIREIQMLENSLGKDFADHMGNFASGTMSNLFNILEDFDEGRIYSAMDKSYVRELKIGARVIPGLLTELYAKDWENMTLEEMWDSLLAKIDKFEDDIRHFGLPKVLKTLDDIGEADAKKRAIFGKFETTGDSYMQRKIAGAKMVYAIDEGPSPILEDDVYDFIKNGYKIPTVDKNGNIRLMSLNKKLRVVVDGIAAHFKDRPIDDAEIRDLRTKVADSSIVQKVDLFGDGTVLLYNPEEKAIAQAVLKKYKSAYLKWYEKFTAALSTFIALTSIKLKQDQPEISEDGLTAAIFKIIKETFKNSGINELDRQEILTLIKNNI